MEFDENKSARVVVKKQRKAQNLKTFITGELRRSSFRWRARQEAMANARVERGKYKCNSCGDLFGPKQIILDHIEPVVDPKVGDKIYDGAVGSAGFLCEAYEYLKTSKNLTTKDIETLQKKTFYGKEKKPLAYIIGIMNMILHGIEAPNILPNLIHRFTVA